MPNFLSVLATPLKIINFLQNLSEMTLAGKDPRFKKKTVDQMGESRGGHGVRTLLKVTLLSKSLTCMFFSYIVKIVVV